MKPLVLVPVSSKKISPTNQPRSPRLALRMSARQQTNPQYVNQPIADINLQSIHLKEVQLRQKMKNQLKFIVMHQPGQPIRDLNVSVINSAKNIAYRSSEARYVSKQKKKKVLEQTKMFQRQRRFNKQQNLHKKKYKIPLSPKPAFSPARSKDAIKQSQNKKFRRLNDGKINSPQKYKQKVEKMRTQMTPQMSEITQIHESQMTPRAIRKATLENNQRLDAFSELQRNQATKKQFSSKKDQEQNLSNVFTKKTSLIVQNAQKVKPSIMIDDPGIQSEKNTHVNADHIQSEELLINKSSKQIVQAKTNKIISEQLLIDQKQQTINSSPKSIKLETEENLLDPGNSASSLPQVKPNSHYIESEQLLLQPEENNNKIEVRSIVDETPRFTQVRQESLLVLQSQKIIPEVSNRNSSNDSCVTFGGS